MGNGFSILTQFDIGMTDVLGDFEAHFFRSVRQDIQSHLVHLYGGRVFLLVIVDVAHIHTDPSREGVLFSLDDFIVFREGFLEHAAGLQAEGMVEGHGEG